MQNKNETIFSVVIAVVTIIIIWIFVSYNKTDTVPLTSNYTNNATSTATSTIDTVDTPLDVFAKCVAGKGLVMYGAVWCSHCLNEKNAFGDSFKYINYVECPDNIKLCTDKGINGYPTWIDGSGKKFEGEQGLKGIAKISGCELPQ